MNDYDENQIRTVVRQLEKMINLLGWIAVACALTVVIALAGIVSQL